MKDRIIHIFFAFAEDALPLLEIAKHEIELINHWFSTKIPLNLTLHDWKHTGVANMGNPEQKVLERMPIDKSDIFMAVFRFNYGKPTGNKHPVTGVEYKSGMEEEFYTAYEYWKEHKRPDIIILKSEEDIPRKSLRSQDDLANIEAFFGEFSAAGKHPGLFNTFYNEMDFKEIFRRNIMSRVVDILLDSVGDKGPTLGDYYQNLGLMDLYLERQNDARNASKKEQIRKTNQLRLHARTCYSFISRVGSFYPEIHKALERGMTFKLIMQNPWSLNAMYSARSEKQFKKLFAEHQKEQKTDELLKAYEQTHWYKERYLLCLRGYEELKAEFRGQIKLRVSDMDLSNSIFISDEELFFEPYLNSLPVGRPKPPLYEIRANQESILYKDAVRDFEDLWSSSYSYEVFLKYESNYRARLHEFLDRQVKG